MTDTNTAERQAWVSAGCPGIKQQAPIFQRDERGRNMFKYKHSSNTDLSKTFARVRKQIAREQAQ